MITRAKRSITAAGILLLTLFAFAGAADAASATFSLDPRASYLRANNETPPNALAVDLSLLGATPGSTVLLEILGDYTQRAGATPTSNTFGVFSSTNALLGPFFPAGATNYNRVLGAIDAGTDAFSANTFHGNLPTDITQDFSIGSSLQILVPEGAKYLFAAAHDSAYTDNADADRNYAIRVSTVATAPAVPLPASVWGGLALLGGVVAHHALRTRRRHQ